MDGISNFFNVLAAILAVSAILAFLALLQYGKNHDKADRTCDAPCTVNFNSGMAEDMFWIDYRGAKDHKGTVRVYCSTPDNRFHEVACP